MKNILGLVLLNEFELPELSAFSDDILERLTKEMSVSGIETIWLSDGSTISSFPQFGFVAHCGSTISELSILDPAALRRHLDQVEGFEKFDMVVSATLNAPFVNVEDIEHAIKAAGRQLSGAALSVTEIPYSNDCLYEVSNSKTFVPVDMAISTPKSTYVLVPGLSAFSRNAFHAVVAQNERFAPVILPGVRGLIVTSELEARISMKILAHA
jgi:hypothetical protein